MKRLMMCLLIPVFAVSMSLVACDKGGGDSNEGSGVASDDNQGDETATDETATDETATDESGDETEDQPESAPTSQPSGEEHAAEGSGGDAHADGGMNVLAEGAYDPAAVVAQPGASMGDITTCPVSGEAFVIDADRPHVEHEGQEVYFCCASCVRPFQRDPTAFLAN